MKSKGNTMHLIVIRHGQTTGDVEDRCGGAYDDLLSPEGEAQVRQLAEELAGKGIQQIYTSPLRDSARIKSAVTREYFGSYLGKKSIGKNWVRGEDLNL